MGAQGEPRICDFGLSAVVATVTETPASLALIAGGSRPWLAPEIIDVSSSSSTPADTYAFAVAILELFAGGIPPDFAVASQEHTLALLASGLAKSLWGMLQRCWSSDPLARPSMDDVTLCLMSFDTATDRPPEVLPPSDQPRHIHPQDPPISSSVSALEPGSSTQNLNDSSDDGIPECAPEPLSLWIDLHPLNDARPIPECAPESVSLWVNLHPIDDISDVPTRRPDSPALWLDLHPVDDYNNVAPESTPEPASLSQELFPGKHVDFTPPEEETEGSG